MRMILYKSIESIELRRQDSPRAQEHDVNEIDMWVKAKYCGSLLNYVVKRGRMRGL